ncbi:MAG TPA: LLM class flavin-dependent oxidoreductase [Pseudonocardiaceae bacterium]|jgi:alkanesulfonate monooxygenase|nr:LLM class flavin-dependent oxidoreductase [Pseudonocardiaceae bacterium]
MMHVYSVTPESVSRHQQFREDFRTRLVATARAAEAADWSGILVPHNMHEVDPWIVAGHLGSVTERLIPLIAVQPACIPPHAAASCAAAYAALYNRPLYFNLVAGARDDEMRQIGDSLDHDQRYDRLREYGRTLRALLNGEKVDGSGKYYDYRKFRLEPCPEVLGQCKIFVAGSSPASVSVATEIADVVVTHPAPFPEWRERFLEPLLASGYRGELGIRIGLVCRPDADEAWQLAADRFPPSWLGRQETLLKTRSQNTWSRELAERAVARSDQEQTEDGVRDTYWLGAFQSGQASAPFLVGSYGDVAARLSEYTQAGVGHVLLNGVHDDDYQHTQEGLRWQAAKLAGN